MLFDGDTFQHGGRLFRFDSQPDDDNSAPWEREDGRGIVAAHPCGYSKKAGERVLHYDRSQTLYFDMKGTTAKAKAEGWGLSDAERAKLAAKLGRQPTQGEVTAAAVEQEYEYLRRWCADLWSYIGVVVTHLPEGEDGPDGDSESVWGVDSDSTDYVEETAHDLAGAICAALDEKEAAEREAARVAEESADPSTLFPTVEDTAASGFIFSIHTNGGATVDAITVTTCDGDALLITESGAYCTWAERVDVSADYEAANPEEGDATLVELSLGDLDPAAREQIRYSINLAWRDFLTELAAGKAGAPTREKAAVNEGTHESAGDGIYRVGEGWAVRMDSADAGDDRGPYMTPRDALAATLPEDYSLSGPEYHPLNNPNSLAPTPGAAEKLAALKARLWPEESDGTESE